MIYIGWPPPLYHSHLPTLFLSLHFLFLDTDEQRHVHPLSLSLWTEAAEHLQIFFFVASSLPRSGWEIRRNQTVTGVALPPPPGFPSRRPSLICLFPSSVVLDVSPSDPAWIYGEVVAAAPNARSLQRCWLNLPAQAVDFRSGALQVVNGNSDDSGKRLLRPRWC